MLIEECALGEALRCAARTENTCAGQREHAGMPIKVQILVCARMHLTHVISAIRCHLLGELFTFRHVFVNDQARHYILSVAMPA